MPPRIVLPVLIALAATAGPLGAQNSIQPAGPTPPAATGAPVPGTAASGQPAAATPPGPVIVTIPPEQAPPAPEPVEIAPPEPEPEPAPLTISPDAAYPNGFADPADPFGNDLSLADHGESGGFDWGLLGLFGLLGLIPLFRKSGRTTRTVYVDRDDPKRVIREEVEE